MVKVKAVKMKDRFNYSRQLNSKKLSVMLIIICIIIYGLSYFARINYNITLTHLSQIIPLDIVGLIGTVYFLCYAIGQLVNGFVISKISPFVYLPIGLFISACCNLVMAFANSAGLMIIIWGLNGFAQSMLWSPILIIFTKVIKPSLKEKALLWISVAAPVGTLFCYLLGGYLINYGYKLVFIFAVILLFFAILLILSFYFFARKKLVLTENTADELPANISQSTPHKKQSIFFYIGIIPFIMLIMSVIVQGMLKDGISTWIPTMIMDKFTLSASTSVFLTMLLPIINVSGAFIATFFYKKMKNGREFFICFMFMSLAACLTAVMLNSSINQYGLIILLSIITTSMFGFNQVSIVLIPLRFKSSNKMAALSGTLNALTYLGSAIAAYVIGVIREKSTWTVVIIFILIIAVTGAVVTLIAQIVDLRNSRVKKEAT